MISLFFMLIIIYKYILIKCRKAVKILMQNLTAFLWLVYYNNSMTVYIDIIFLENFIINYIILYSTGLVQKITIRKTKIIISAAIGAGYVIVSFIENNNIFTKLYMKIVLSIIMIYIAYNPQNVKKMLKSIILFYLISFATGGCALALLFIVSPNTITISNGVIVGKNSIKVTILAGVMGFILIKYSFKMNKEKLKNNDLICNLTIKICGKLIKTKAFIDSGNNLIDPLNGKSVIIAEEELIHNNGIKYLEGGDNKTNIRIIPYNTIGKSNGILMGIESEYVEIEYQGEKKLVNNVIIGIYNKKISAKYSALVGINLINGGNENEYSSLNEKDIF